MNVTLRVDPDMTLNGKFHENFDHPGWAQGWGVIKGPPEDREFAGIFVDQAAAETAAANAGPGFEVRWGSYSENEQDFITGDSDDAVC
jgi:hypothetical protein